MTTYSQADKLNAEIAKLIAETTKINKEAEWYGRIAVSSILAGTIAGIIGIIKLVA